MEGGEKLFYNTHPLFTHGRILKLEMLEQLRDFPKDVIDIMLSQYSDGIILGCDISVSDDYIIVSKGLIKQDGILYMLKEDTIVPYNYTNDTAILKVRFLGETKNSDFIRYGTEMFIDETLSIQSDEIELCRFKIKTGARLRVDYTDFEDMNTEYDTVNLINAPFSAKDKETLNPKILKAFAKEAFENNLTNPLDICFAMTCMQESGAIARDLIMSYVTSRLGVGVREYSNRELYEYLRNILNDIKEGRQALNNSFRLDHKKILVD